ncbi:MAG: hypothetical protein CSB13_00540 [Chloroflexi bacterium]|nr:MAG: hypothetical protein CSB13_00540 [Chloroflexota bacterium]
MNHRNISTDDVLESLRAWHGNESVVQWPLAGLRLGLQVVDEEDSFSSMAGSKQTARNRAILNRGLYVLRTQSPDSEELLRERFEHRRDVLAVANRLNISESSIYYRQRQAISLLTEILNRLEENASSDWGGRMLSRLDLPTYSKLFGVDEIAQMLGNTLQQENEPFIVAIDGLGGMGKTALADKVARNLIEQMGFEEIAWITAKQTHLSSLGRLKIESGRPALTFPLLLEKLADQFDIPESPGTSQLKREQIVINYLRERSCLVVIDNLETVADYHSLLPELRANQNPTKYLLTSRLRLYEDPDVFSISLKELPQESAFALLREEARRTGFLALLESPDEELQKIYDVVGGHPLALKLVVGQLRFRSLPRVLDGYEPSKEKNSGELFDYIYQETWETLDDDCKMTLMALSQASETGFTFDHIVSISGLSESSVDRSLEELILLSLVDLGGSLYERRYRLHRLTEVFILKMFET